MFIESSMPSDKMLCSKVSHVDGCDSKWAADLSKETKELVYKAGRWIPMKESIWSPDRSFSRSIIVILLCFANASATVTSARTFVWPECRRCALRSSLNGMTKRGCTSRRRQSESDHAMFGRLARSSRRLTHLIGVLTLASLNVDIWCRTASRSPLHTLGSSLCRKKRYGINSLDSARMMDQLQLGILSPLDVWLDHTWSHDLLNFVNGCGQALTAYFVYLWIYMIQARRDSAYKALCRFDLWWNGLLTHGKGI